MKNLISTALVCVMIFFSFIHSYSNPKHPLDYEPITEFQILDSANWKIEVQFKQHQGTGILVDQKLTPPCSVNCVGLEGDIPNTVPAASKIWVYQNGYGVISNHQFPTVFIYNKFKLFTINCSLAKQWEVSVNKYNTSSQSHIQRTYYLEMGSVSYIRDVKYLLTNNPSFGEDNSKSSVYSLIKGIIRYSDKKPLSNIFVCYTEYYYNEYLKTLPIYAKTNNVGQFTFQYVSIPNARITFVDTSYKSISAVIIPSIPVDPDSTYSLDTCLWDVNPTAIKSHSEVKAINNHIRILSLIYNKTERCLTSYFVCSSDSREPFVIKYYSLSGQLLFETAIENQGKGTYTHVWNLNESKKGFTAPQKLICIIASSRFQTNKIISVY